MKLKFNEENMNQKQQLKKEGALDNKKIILSNFPSMQRRHIKNQKKVVAAFEDLEKNHNHSWIEEIWQRNQKNLDRLALFYRGNVATYQQMFDNITKTAKSLKKLGVNAGEKVSMCVSNCPEMLYFLGALSMIGAEPKVFGYDFAPDYIEEIMNESSSKVFIATDNLYGGIKNMVDRTHIKNKVIISLTDSLKDGIDPYAYYDNFIYTFQNKVPCFKQEDSCILSFQEFIELGETYEGEIKHDGKLHDDFTITYTSGSTKDGRPKAIVHTNDSFITMARFHDKDLSGLPETKHIRGLAHIPPHSNTNLITSISDVLSQGGTVALEPIYHKNFFAYSLIINEPNFVTATRSFWIQGIKDFNNKEELTDKKLPFLYIPTSVGEPTSPGEEKFINQGLKKLNAGRDKLKVMTAPLSMGGGDCEHGGLFFQLYKSIYDKVSFIAEGRGLTPFQLVDLAVLREDGTECSYNELGHLVANSRCTMKEYENNPKATEEFFMTDAYGRRWADCKVWAFIDPFGDVHIKGRIGNELQLQNGEKIPLFMIADAISKDTKNILSCEVVMTKDDTSSIVPVAHVELQPDRKQSMDKVIAGIIGRVNQFCSYEVIDNLFLEIRDYKDPFPLTGCGKRKVLTLEEEGITDKAIRLMDSYTNTTVDKSKVKIKK